MHVHIFYIDAVCMERSVIERIDDRQSVDDPPILHILGVEHGALRAKRGMHDQGIPE